ncbi:dUTP diphosphatase [Mesobacillus foraminis]|uniref:dUTP diphosphatase n=1 Tax=Mesobacillus foraminis TaxID=279826 RepID=UPI000EF510BC|nr:dUTP diphosphatase [Mesobacillus foraminis]
MNTEKLFAMQKNLDRHIEEKHGLASEDLFGRKILALLVELGELANETRCFKFWSTKAPSERQIILEEFVDGIHFILSLGIECSFTAPEYRNGVTLSNHSVYEQFLVVYGAVTSFQLTKAEKQYHYLFSSYMELGKMLGFTPEDIEQAYIEKNEVNYERQRKGY